MNKSLTIFVLAGFVSISLFSLPLMQYDGSSHDMACLATIINGSKSPCPEEDPLGFAGFHGSVIQKISGSPALSVSALVYLSLIFSAALFGFLTLRLVSEVGVGRAISGFNLRSEVSLVSSRNLFWISLHENSPSFR